MLKAKWRLGAAVAGSVLILSGCSAVTEGEGGSGVEGQQEQAAAEAGGQDPGGDAGQADMPEPDLDSVPDVVAEVNGTEISKEDFTTVYEVQFQQMAMQSQMSGQEVDQDQLKNMTAEGLVGNELLAQEADNRGIEASDEDAEQKLAEYAETNQMSPDEFIAANEEQGMDETAMRDEISSQIVIEDLLTDEFGEFEATEDEVQATYQEAEAQQQMGGQAGGAQELPPLDEVRPQVEEQVINQKQMESTQKLVEDLREKGDVTVHL
ncbi:SurA N-terminal domain-containing protein [Corynebacterium halotolerans]|uniref:SurA N-terminal domain-containing protein n=1 Tax=Corynebacterium halotolerans TaxID=225326 RepID=UPI003CFA5341